MITSRWILACLLAFAFGAVGGLGVVWALPPHLQCAADPECGRQADRWWHSVLILAVVFAPFIATAVAWRRSARRGG